MQAPTEHQQRLAREPRRSAGARGKGREPLRHRPSDGARVLGGGRAGDAEVQEGQRLGEVAASERGVQEAMHRVDASVELVLLARSISSLQLGSVLSRIIQVVDLA